MIRGDPYNFQEIIMPGTGATRQDRIELWATKKEKRLLAAAAAHERLDVSSFIMRERAAGGT